MAKADSEREDRTSKPETGNARSRAGAPDDARAKPARELHLEAVVARAAVGLAVIDSQGRVTEYNDAFARVLEESPERATVPALFERIHPDDHELVAEISEKLGRGRIEACTFEARLRGGSGSYAWLQVDVSRVESEGERFYTIQLSDISRRREAEDQYRTSARQFRDAFMGAPVGMEMRGMHGSVVWTNHALQRMFDMSESEYRDAPMSKLVHEDDLEPMAERMSALLAGTSEVAEAEVRMIHRTGKVLHCQVHASLARSETGEPKHFITQIIDVTSRKRAEAGLAQRAEFDRVVTALATNFINLPVDRIDSGVDLALEQIARFVGADRSAIFRLDSDGDVIRSVDHQWRAPDAPEMMEFADRRIWDFMSASLRRGDTVYETDLVNDAPVDDDLTRDLVANEIRAFVCVPFSHGTTQGFIAFSSRNAVDWGVSRLALLRIGAEMIANVIARRKTDIALRESTQRLTQMADNVQTLFWVCDAESLELTYASRALGKIFGVLEPAVRGESRAGTTLRAVFDSIILAEDLEPVYESFAEARKRRAEFEYRIRASDGSVRWLRTRAFPVVDPSGRSELIAGVTDDITEERRVNADLAYHGRFERLISNLATDFIDAPTDKVEEGIKAALESVAEFTEVDLAYFATTDPRTLAVHESYHWVSKTGAAHEAAIGEICFNDYPWTRDQLLDGRVVHVPDMERLPQEAKAERKAAEFVGMRSAVTCPIIRDGALVGVLGFNSLEQTRRWGAETLTVFQTVASLFSGLLERQAAQHALERRIEFERLIGRLALDLLTVGENELDEGIEQALEELTVFLGYDAATVFRFDAEGGTLSQAHFWESREGMLDSSNMFKIPVESVPWTVDRLRTPGAVYALAVDDMPDEAPERELLRAAGLTYFIQMPLFGASGSMGFIGFGCVGRVGGDVTDLAPLLHIAADLFTNALERREASHALREHQSELAHVLRVGTVSELAPWLAHELNQPLSAIMSFASGAKLRLGADNRDIESIREAMEQILAQAKRAGETVASLRRLVRKHEPKREWRKMNDLVISAASLLTTEAREHGVEVIQRLDARPAWVQVDPIQIEQVILNLGRNGFDAIRASKGRERVLRLSTEVTTDSVRVAVLDSGRGIARDVADQLFEAFTTTKEGGLGLGLSLCKSIVEAHDGHIDATSRDDGAEFRFTVPAARQPPES